jgi:hypothetical protein
MILLLLTLTLASLDHGTTISNTSYSPSYHLTGNLQVGTPPQTIPDVFYSFSANYTMVCNGSYDFALSSTA